MEVGSGGAQLWGKQEKQEKHWFSQLNRSSGKKKAGKALVFSVILLIVSRNQQKSMEIR